MEPTIVWQSMKLPVPEALVKAEVCVVYPSLTSANVFQSPAYFLHGIRNGILARLGPEKLRKEEERYTRAAPSIAERIAAALEAVGVTGAIGVTPPSSRSDALLFLKTLMHRGIVTVDISDRVRRSDPTFRAGVAKNWSDVRSSVVVVDSGPCISARALVVVDDVFSSGRSVAATVLALREKRVLPESCPVFVVAVLSTAV